MSYWITTETPGGPFPIIADDDDAVREFFGTSTRNQLAAERDAGVAVFEAAKPL